jgi:ATP-dependent Clp protease protease subunit
LNTIITETTEHGEMPVDVYQKLANDRILFICDHIDDGVATDVAATLLLKDQEDPDRKITLFINSESGDTRSVFMIYDVMNMISSPIETVCIGSAMDEVVILLASGSEGMRFATKNSIIAVGQLINNNINFSDLADAKRLLAQSVSDNKKMMEVLAKKTGKTFKQVSSDFDRKVFFTAAQSMKYGIIDKIVSFNKRQINVP